MPGRRRSGDMAGRRDEVAQATLRVIARDGLDGASLRAIAQELGCTTGVLTHHFRDKEALMDFALGEIVERLDRAAASQDAWTSLDDVKAYVSVILPTTAEGKSWWRVWLAFTVAALSNERLGANHARLYADLRERWTQRFVDLRGRGLVRTDIDPAMEAESLLCLIDGLGVQALITPRAYPARRQIEIVAHHVDRLAALPARSRTSASHRA